MMFSVNNRLIVEPYIKGALESKVQNGIATPGQKDGVKGLKVLVNFQLPNSQWLKAGSTVYIREEVLNQPWASKLLTSPAIEGRFMIVELTYVEFMDDMPS
jgi:hypothetical protein